MLPAAVMEQAAQGDAANAILWMVLTAFLSLGAAAASIWRSFVTPKEHATLRNLKELEERVEKHLANQREDYARVRDRMESREKEIADLRVALASSRVERDKLDAMARDIADLRVSIATTQAEIVKLVSLSKDIVDLRLEFAKKTSGA